MQRQYPSSARGTERGGSGRDGEYGMEREDERGTGGAPSSSGWSSWVNPAAYMQSSGEPREKGAKRKMIASYLKAANEVRQSYTSGYFSDRAARRDIESVDSDGGGGWTDTELIHNGKEEMIVFPSYARRRIDRADGGDGGGRGGVRVGPTGYTQHHPSPNENDPNQQQHDVETFHNDDTLNQEQWQLPEYVEQKPIVDVDVRGWIYYPQSGPLTRKNRLVMGLARQICGLPAQGRGVTREDQEAAKEAERALGESDDSGMDFGSRPSSSEGVDPMGPAEPGVMKRLSWKAASAVTGTNTTPQQGPNVPLTGQELDTAHGFLKSRLAPFMARPTPHLPVTIFFYNSKSSQSRTVVTNEFGHFSIRAGLPFVPSHVRVLASEKLHETEEIKLLEPHGISLISDIDDTIKHSAVTLGTREIFRNTFIRDLNTLVVPGVTELYNTLHLLEVPIHYVSNSPWQLYPLLSQFFSQAGLPLGSFHLKQYSGMLQGIFEPVAERKKGNLERILKDFPERRFILMGDSGEADLEVYSEVALANPGRIRAIFIRDITTKEDIGFFSNNQASPSPSGKDRRGGLSMDTNDAESATKQKRPPPPLRPNTISTGMPTVHGGGGSMSGNNRDSAGYREPAGDLIDFSSSDDEGPEELKPMQGVSMYPTTAPPPNRRHGSISSISSRSSQVKSPPPLPKKPTELKGERLQSPLGTPQPISPMMNPLEASSGYIPASNLGDKSNSTGHLPSLKPPKPPKPPSLSDMTSGSDDMQAGRHHSAPDNRDFKDAPPPPPRRKANTWNEKQPAVSASANPTAYRTRLSAEQSGSNNEFISPSPAAPPKPSSLRPSNMLRRYAGHGGAETFDNTHAAAVATNTHRHSPSGASISSQQAAPGVAATYDPASGIEKKVWLWNQRWERAKETLNSHGILLKQWRKGTDVLEDAVSVVQDAMTDIENQKSSSKKE